MEAYASATDLRYAVNRKQINVIAGVGAFEKRK
jgi:hypothetical protein